MSTVEMFYLGLCWPDLSKKLEPAQPSMLSRHLFRAIADAIGLNDRALMSAHGT
jgi:hypothetical protein